MSEKEIINILSDEIVSLNVGHEKYEQAVKGLLDLYNKEKEKNKGISKLEADLYEANNRINDLLDIVKQKDKEIDWLVEEIHSIVSLGEFIDNNINKLETKEEIKKYFEERCK